MLGDSLLVFKKLAALAKHIWNPQLPPPSSSSLNPTLFGILEAMREKRQLDVLTFILFNFIPIFFFFFKLSVVCISGFDCCLKVRERPQFKPQGGNSSSLLLPSARLHRFTLLLLRLCGFPPAAPVSLAHQTAQRVKRHRYWHYAAAHRCLCCISDGVYCPLANVGQFAEDAIDWIFLEG